LVQSRADVPRLPPPPVCRTHGPAPRALRPPRPLGDSFFFSLKRRVEVPEELLLAIWGHARRSWCLVVPSSYSVNYLLAHRERRDARGQDAPRAWFKLHNACEALTTHARTLIHMNTRTQTLPLVASSKTVPANPQD
jgi:hypothetical protein